MVSGLGFNEHEDMTTLMMKLRQRGVGRVANVDRQLQHHCESELYWLQLIICVMDRDAVFHRILHTFLNNIAQLLV